MRSWPMLALVVLFGGACSGAIGSPGEAKPGAAPADTEGQTARRKSMVPQQDRSIFIRVTTP